MPPAPANSAAALNNYQSFAAGMQDPTQIESAQEQALGVPAASQQVSGLRQAITNTTNLLNNVAPSVMGRTQNSLVTSAQATRQIGNEQAPIAKELSDQTSKEALASSDLKDLLGKAQNMTALKQADQQTKLGVLKDIYNSIFGKEQADAKAQADAAASAESVREFNTKQSADAAQNAVTNRQNQQKIDQTGNPEATPQDIAGVQNDFIKLQGSDGYVSPQTYARAALNWANAGYSLKDFSKNFSKYKNPNNPYYTL